MNVIQIIHKQFITFYLFISLVINEWDGGGDRNDGGLGFRLIKRRQKPKSELG